MAKTDSLRSFLRGLEIFGGLEGRSLESLIRVLSKETWKAGTTIFQEGELGRTMYVLRSGEVEVRRNNKEGKPVPIVRLGVGECFGEMALVELQRRSATVVVTKKATAFTLNNLSLYQLYQQNNYAYIIVLQNICRLMSRRIRKADGRIADFLTAKKAKKTRR